MSHTNVWLKVSRILFFLALLTCAASAIWVSGCRDTTMSDGEQALSPPSCYVSRLRFPTTYDDFQHLYQGRGFYSDGNHLGRDLAIPEGTAIHPIACGTVRVFQPATGYGTLAVVIEHRLPQPKVVRNGLGEEVSVQSFLSIYGHLRKTPLLNAGDALAIRVGDQVGPDDIIGYVQNDAQNGDGAEHLHLGIRLQTETNAELADKDWFRGYDAMPSQRRYFADPAPFLDTLMKSGINVSWHPAGTVLSRQGHPDNRWLVGEGEILQPLTPLVADLDHLKDRSISVSDDEVWCYHMRPPYLSELTGSQLLKFDDSSTVYEYNNLLTPVRYAFISYEAFISWGWKDADITVKPAKERAAFLAAYQDRGFRRLRDGTLVKGKGASEVAVVSDGRRLPIFDWSTFLALGYDPMKIVEIDPATLDAVAYPRGPLITPDSIIYCASALPCFNEPSSCDAGMKGGGGVEPSDMAISMPPDMAVSTRDMSVQPQTGLRYEFRVLDNAGWGAKDPFLLFDQNWKAITCTNTGTTHLESVADGWRRCDVKQTITPFTGNFFSSNHPDWGYMGFIATIGNTPQRCTPTNGVEWRLTDLGKNQVFFQGSAANLPCASVGMYDFHALPPH